MGGVFAWLRDYLSRDAATAILWSCARAAIILIAVYVLIRITDRFVRLLRTNIVGVMRRRTPGVSGIELDKRSATIGGIIRRTIKVALWLMAGVNMTREFSYYIFDVGVAYKEDTDRVVAVLRDVAADLQATDLYGASILEPLEVLGVDQFADSAVVIKARIKTMPAKQWEVGREMNRRIKRRFDEERIEIPFPHRSFHFGDASSPIRLQVDRPTRDELRALVREVLAEAADRA